MRPLRARYSRIRKEVEGLLAQARVIAPPVPVEKIAALLGAQIVRSGFEQEVSGLLVRRGKSAIIGVNNRQADVRQRFTIAHEIGHLVMHNLDGEEDVHVDKAFRVQFRSPASSTAEDVAEIEANAFAASLLMPEEFLREDAKHVTIDFEDAEMVADLAQRYDVSGQAMTFRLMNLFQPGREA